MNESSERAKQQLAEFGRAKDRTRRLSWALIASASLLTVLLAVAMADYWFILPPWLRITGFVLMCVTVATGVIGYVLLQRAATRLKQAALEIEAARPDIGCVVSTAAEYLSGERKLTHEYEPELVAALQQQASRKLEGVTPAFHKRLLRPAGALAAAVAILLIFTFAVPVASIALKRTVIPWSSETYTKIAVQPGSIELPVGKDLAITNFFSGRLPQNPELHWRNEGSERWETVALTTGSNGIYPHLFKALQSSVIYKVSGNDAATPEFSVTTYVPPAVEQFKIGVTYPEYTGKQPYRQEAPDLKVLRASEIQYEIKASTALAQARLRFSSGEHVDLRPAGDNLYAGKFKAVKEADYWIELADAKGHTGGNEKPYQLKIFPDKPPKVDITEPGQDLRADATNTIPLKIAASDDFGVSEIKIIYHKLGAPEQTMAVQFTNSANGEKVGHAEIALAGLGLKEYELVAYHAEALDNNTLDGPGKAASQVYFIEITNEEGGKCKSQCKGQKVNLLTIQKQIIADTTALAAKANPDKFNELVKRQTEASDFAQIYIDALTGAGAPSEPLQVMEHALKSMRSATDALQKQDRSAAIPHEEIALADLYQVLKLLPELENLPTLPPPVQQEQKPQDEKLAVVLQAIKKEKKEQPEDKELQAALEEAKRLSRSQAGLNQKCENPGQGQGKSESEQKSEAQAKTEGEKKSERQADSKASGQKGKKGTKNGEGQPGELAQKGEKGEPNENGAKGEEGEKDSENKPGDGMKEEDVEKLAELQEQLSKEAAEFAEKLERLAERDGRVSHNTGQKASEAAGQMSSAAQAMRQGNAQTAGTAGALGRVHMDKVAAMLERAMRDAGGFSDLSQEEFPKEYEALISEYLRKLSYEK